MLKSIVEDKKTGFATLDNVELQVGYIVRMKSDADEAFTDQVIVHYEAKDNMWQYTLARPYARVNYGTTYVGYETIKVFATKLAEFFEIVTDKNGRPHQYTF